MQLPRRAIVVAAGAAVALAGLALGAQLQEEGFLAPDTQSQTEINQSLATGAPVLLTGALVGAGVALAASGLAVPLAARRMPRSQAGLERGGLLAVLFLGTYVLVNLAQTAFPTVVLLAAAGTRGGSFANNLIASNSPALPSALLPVFGLLAATLLVLLWALRRLIAPSDPAPWDDAPQPDPEALLHRQTGMLLLVTPFLGLATWGAFRLVAGTPAGPSGDPYRIAFPLVALVLMGFLATGTLKAWQLVRFLRDPRTAPLCEEAWAAAGRVEAWLVGGLAALALVASFFRPLEQPLLQTGQTFGSDLRRHLQFLGLALVPLAPAWSLHREGVRLFTGPPVRGAAPTSLWLATQATALGLSLLLAGIATLLLEGPVWGWMLATAPAAIAAQRLRAPRANAALLLLAAWATWCLGNSLSAHYDPTDAALIQFNGSPGVLALWRLLGAALAGLAVARLARSAAHRQGAKVAWPLAACTGLCVIAIALLELPLSVWTESSSHGQLVAVGTALASQDAAVQGVMHAIALAAALAAAIMVSRLLRPEWFGRQGRFRLAQASARPIG